MSKQQHIDAIKLLDIIAGRVRSQSAPVVGYDTAAELIGRKTPDDDGRHMGQVTSRIDYACLIAGLPMLALHWVRDIKGNQNANAFINNGWDDFLSEIFDMSVSHQWTDDEIEKIRLTLANLDNIGARAFWSSVGEWSSAKRRYNLHRSVPIIA